MNPWVTVWTQPRRTIRALVADNPEFGVLGLALASGVYHALDRASGRSAGDQIPFLAVLALAALVGPLGGVAKLYWGAALVRWTGQWLGGAAPPEHLRTAIAWGSVPLVVSLMLWLPLLFVVGPEMFTTATPGIDGNSLVALLFFGIVFAQIVLGVWSFVLTLKGVGEVQGFSAWKALLNIVLAGAVVVVPMLAIIGLALAIDL